MSSDSPAAILFDKSGNPVGVTFDGNVYRLQVQSTLTDGYGNTVDITDGALAVTQLSTTGTITSINAVNIDTLILASNPSRRGIFFYNDTSSATLKIGLTTNPVTTSLFSVLIGAGGFFEIPFGYTGEIRGIWSVNEADGYALVTELV